MILLGNKINCLFFNILFLYFLFVGSQSDDCGTPQDCLVSDWEEFSPCSHSCGDSGVQSRKRTILKEASCSGECNLNITETRECSRQCCPKNCVYSEWTKWFKTGKSSECELPGERWAYARQRQITEVASCGGYCDNHKVERKCGNLLCAKDCAISPWTVWSLCQAPCEQDGIRFRTKIILQEPECGGKECGITEEEEECKSGKCPVDCQLGPWSSWSTCDVACGKSNYTRSRFVQLPEYDGAVCTEEPIESQTQTCENYVNVDCMVGPWSAWTDCVLNNGNCGRGSENRTRDVIIPAECQGQECPPLIESRECFGPCCKQDCIVANWEEWTPCSTVCGEGLRQRLRAVSIPQACNGTMCPDLLEEEGCSVTETIHCEMSPWSDWSNCSTSCGTGSQTRSRNLLTPAYCNGNQCASMDLEEEQGCESYTAKQDCQVGDWLPWNECIRDCSGGMQARTRRIISSPECQGTPCPSLQHSDWGPWLECIRDCSGGMQQRKRTIVQTEQCGGRRCSTLMIRTCHPDCTQLCKNGVCSCRKEYQLLNDNHTCVEIQCPPKPRMDYCPPGHTPIVDCLQPQVNCNQGSKFGANCTVNCDNRKAPWSLKGDTNIVTCLGSGNWSKPEVYCGLPNKAPHTLTIDKNEIEENTKAGECMIYMNVKDDPYDKVTYEITNDNKGLFYVERNRLCLTRKADFEDKPSKWNITIRCTDLGGLYVEEVFEFEVLNENDPPTAVIISRDTIPENSPKGTEVGCLRGQDDDPGQNVSLALVNSDKELFETYTGDNGELCVKVAKESDPQCSIDGGTYCQLDREVKDHHMVTVMAIDDGKPPKVAYFDLRIKLSDVNDRPSGISIEPLEIPEEIAVGDSLVTVVTEDQDEDQTHTLELLNDADGMFTLKGNNLTAARKFDFENPLDQLEEFTITVRTTDNGQPSLSFTSNITFKVGDINEKPYELDLSDTNAPRKFEINKPQIRENANAVIIGTVTAKDHDLGDSIVLSLAEGSDTRLSVMTPQLCTPIPGVNIQCMAALVSFLSFNHETEPVVNITLTATDSKGLISNTTVQLQVLDLNDKPTDILVGGSNVSEISVPEGKNDFTIGDLSAEDEDDDGTHVFSLTQSDGGRFVIEQGVLKTSPSANLDYESPTLHEITILVEDSGIDGQSPQTFQKVYKINVQDVNEAPTQISLSNNTIAENSVDGTVIGTLSAMDPDVTESSSQILTFSLVDDGSGRFRIDGNELKVKNSSLLCNNRPCELDFESENEIPINVKVTDNGIPPLSLERSFIVTLTDVNDPPRSVRLAGSSVRENAPPETVVGKLTAVEQDPGQTLTFELLNHTDIFSLAEDFTVSTKASLDYENQGEYFVSVKATDSGSPTGVTTSVVMVSVLDINETPSVIGPLTVTTPETMETGVGIGNITSEDPDSGEKLTLSIQNTGSGFTLKNLGCSDKDGAGSLCVSTLVADRALNYETQDTYTVSVIVSDKNGLTATANVIVNVQDVNDKPKDILVDGQPVSMILVSENSQDTDIAELSALDEDASQVHTFEIIDGDTEIFEIINTNIRVKKDAELDYESSSEYTLLIQVTDSGNPPQRIDKTFTIQVKDLNEAPTGISLDKNQVAENSGEGTVIGELSALDPDNTNNNKQTMMYELLDSAGGRFKVFGTSLQVAQSNEGCLQRGGSRCLLNYEESASHVVRVLVSDSGVPSQSAVFNFTIEVTDVNDKPRNLKLDVDSVNQEIGRLSVSDEDSSQTHTYTLGDDSGGLFTVSDEGVLSQDSALDPTVLYKVTVIATDSGTPPQQISADFTITAVGGNEAPVSVTFTSDGGPIKFEDNKPVIQENSVTDSVIGSLVAIDTGVDQQLTFTVSVNEGQIPVRVDQGMECIKEDGNTKCTVRVHSTQALDYEEVREINLMVTVTDGDGMNRVELFTLTVQNVNEPPYDILYSGNSVVVYENLDDEPLGGFNVKDPDIGDTHTFKLTNENAAKFVIDSSGRLSTAADANLDFETTPAFPLTIEVTDSSGLTYQKDFNVTLLDVNEKPEKIVLSSNKVPEMSGVGTEIGSLSVVDPDGGQTFTFSMIDDAEGRVTLQNGVLKVADMGTDCATLGGSDCLLDFESVTSHDIVVKVTDSGQPSQSLTATLTIDVQDVNDPPTDLTVKVEDMRETAAVGDTIAALQVQDEDTSQTITYTISDDDDMFSVSGNTIVLEQKMDFETKPSHTITVIAADSGTPSLNVTKEFTLNVINVNEPPHDLSVQSVAGGTDFNLNQPIIEENLPPDTLIGQLLVLDPDMSDDVTFSTTSTDVSLYNQDCIAVTKGLRCTADIRTAVTFDYEKQKTSSLAFTATDREGLTIQKEITLTVVDTNDAPENILLTGTLVLDENSYNVTIGSLSATDVDAGQSFTFTIKSDTQDYYIVGNQIRVAPGADINYEERTADTLTISVTDSGQPPKSFQKDFTITIKDVNEQPENIQLSRNRVPEGSEAGFVVGTLTAEDPDNLYKQRQELTYAITEDLGGKFTVEGNSLMINSGDFDYEGKRIYRVVVEVTDSGSTPLSSTEELTVIVTDENDPPHDLQFSANEVTENSAVGTVVGTLSGRDQDAGQTLLYSLQSNRFLTVSDDKVLVSGNIDFETSPTITFTANATDDGNPVKMISKSFTINVKDTNDPPSSLTFKPSDKVVSMEIPESLLTGDTVGTLEVTDADSLESVSFELLENTDDTFKLSSGLPSCMAMSQDTEENEQGGTVCTIKLLMAKPLNYEAGVKELTLEVKIQDKGGQHLTDKWTFTVINSNEAPKDIILEGNITTIPENMAGFVIGGLVTVDEDKADTHIYQIITHWQTFIVKNGNILNVTKALDYEKKSTYNVTIRSTDNGKPKALSYDKVFRFTVGNVNEKPTDITVTPNVVSNNAEVGDIVGVVEVTDPDNNLDPPLQSHTCTVGGDGKDIFTMDTDSMKLKVKGTVPMDKTSLNVRLICQDSGTPRQELAKDLNITIKETVTVPKKLVIQNQRKVPENTDTSFTVGNLQIINVLSNEPIQGFFIYMLTDFSAPFTMEGSTLKSKSAFDYETAPEVKVDVKAVGKDSLGKDVAITETFVIEIEDINEAPYGVSIYGGGRIEENSPPGTKIGNLRTIDQDLDQTYTYKILAVYPGLDSSAAKPEYMGVVTLNGSMLSVGPDSHLLDFEINDKFSVDVETTDSGPSPLSFTDTIHLILNDQNDPPSDISLSNTEIAENSAVGSMIGEFSVMDQDKNQPHTCAVLNRINVPFQMKDNFTLVVSEDVLDYEKTRKYTLEVECRDLGDNGSSLKFLKTFVINVINVNEPPFDIKLSKVELAENNLIGQVLGQVTAKDMDSSEITFSVDEGTGFKLQESNTIVANQVFSFETSPDVKVKVTATDGEGLSTTEEMIVQILDVNEAPDDIMLDNSEITENTEAGKVIGQLTTIDQDRNQQFTYTVMETGQETGYIAVQGDKLVTGDRNLDFEKISQIQISINSTDNGTPPKTLQRDFTLAVLDAEEPPIAIIMTDKIDVAEDTPPQEILSPIQVDDPDIGQSHICQNINRSTPFTVLTNEKKEMSLVLTGPLDYEKIQSYKLIIRCTDGDFDIEKRVNINIGDVNEAPTVISLSAGTVKADAEAGGVIGTLQVQDPDVGQTHTLGVHGANSDILKIEGNKLILKSPIPLSELKQPSPVLNVTIMAADNGNPSLSVMENFKLPITNVEVFSAELPAITIDNTEVPEDAALGYTIGKLYNHNESLGENIVFELTENPNEVFQIKDNKFLVLNKNLTEVEGTSRKITIRVKDIETLKTESQIITIFIKRIARCMKSDGKNCHENARCVQIDDSANHKCECETGYQGDGYTCEDIDDCTPDPCNGNGECVDEVNEFACICNDGFSGENCDVAVKDLANGCSTNPCKNDGVCLPSTTNLHAYTCSCKNGWHGSKCELSVDDCETGNCNGGTCVDKHLTYVCKCPEERQSFRCQYDPSVCQEVSKCQETSGSVCIPKMNQNDNVCAKDEDIVSLLVKKPLTFSDMEELKAQLYDTITSMINAARGRASQRRRRRQASSDMEVYIISVTEKSDDNVDVEFVVLDSDSNEGMYNEEEVLDLLSTRCQEIESDGLSETEVCPAVKKAVALPQVSDEPAKAGLPIPIIAGAAGGVLLIVVLIVILVCLKKKRGNTVDPQRKDKEVLMETDSRRSSGYSSISKSQGKTDGNSGQTSIQENIAG